MPDEVQLLKYGSLFLTRATPTDIEDERNLLEYEHDCKLEVYRVSHETRSGAPVTRVEWRVV
jgi:hypothetical protein